jgi:glycosyltransferase involved in cell wall biosynthesis
MSYIKFISKHMGENIRLLIATNMNGGWDISDLLTSECRKYNITVEEIKKHLIILQNPQQISDFDINVMYNVGNIGINTCDGEGFGLCNFEQAGVGIPQIVPNIGGFKDFFVKGKTSLLIDPKWSYYCDHSRDFVAGEAEICDINDYVSALEYYYNNPEVVEAHGKLCRENILKNYSWAQKGKKLYDIIVEEVIVKEIIPPTTLEKSFSGLDINDLMNKKLESQKDEELEIIEGCVDVDSLSPEEMKEMLKKMLKK